MNIKEYISSGIVESYVLGLASAEEADEFERMCLAHAEARMNRHAFEQQLEENALAVGIAPPKHLKSRIFSEIEIEGEKSFSKKIIDSPEDGRPASAITLRPDWWKYLAAATTVLLVASTSLNFYFFKQYRKFSLEYARLLQAQTEITNNAKVLQAKTNNYATALNILSDSNMAMVKMRGVEKHPSNLATIYWDKKSKDIFLMINNLPKPAAGKQYQLWAIVDGKPIDAGLLNWNDANAIAQMKNIPTAQAFAITLEKKGGTEVPSMDALYVIGNV